MSVTNEIPITEIERLAARLPEPGTVDVTIEVLGEHLGDQVEALRLPWHALIYDSASDVLELSVGGRSHDVPVILRHEIRHPTRLWIEEDGPSIETIAIEQGDGPRTLVRFHDRKALSSGH